MILIFSHRFLNTRRSLSTAVPKSETSLPSNPSELQLAMARGPQLWQVQINNLCFKNFGLQKAVKKILFLRLSYQLRKQDISCYVGRFPPVNNHEHMCMDGDNLATENRLEISKTPLFGWIVTIVPFFQGQSWSRNHFGWSRRILSHQLLEIVSRPD